MGAGAIGAVVGGDLLGSFIEGDAARSAANTQADYGRQALTTEQQALQTQAYETSPERNIGTVALYQLASMLGIDPRQAFPGGIPGETSPQQQASGGGPFAAFHNMQSGAFDPSKLVGKLPTPGAPGSEFGSLNKQFTMADFFANVDPAYQFRLQQGQQGIESSAAARGMQLSGSNLKDLQSFGQGMASEEYQHAFDRFQTQQQNQFNRIGELAGLGTQAREALGQSALNTGQNMAQTQMGIGNALGAGKAAQGAAIGGGLKDLGGDIGFLSMKK